LNKAIMLHRFRYSKIQQARILQFIRRLAINTASISFSQSIRVVLNVALSIVIANQLGAGGLGKYAILNAYLLFFQQLSLAGIPKLIIRQVAQDAHNASEWFSNATINQIISSIVGTLLFWGVASLLSYDLDLIYAFYIAAISLLFFTFSSTVEAFLQAQEKMQYTILIQLLGRGVQIFGSMLLLFWGYGIISIAWMITIGQIVAAFVSIFLARRLKIWVNFNFRWSASLNLFKQAFEFNLLQFSVIIFNKLDVLILSMFVDEATVGLYNAAWLVIQLATTLLAGFSNAIYPIFSRYYIKTRQRFVRFFIFSLFLGFMVSSFASILIFIFSKLLITIPYPNEEYAASTQILRFLSPFVLFSMCNAIMGNALMASKNQRFSVIVSSVKLIIGFFVYLVLVNQFSAIGAAISTVITSIIGTIINGYFVIKITRR